MPWRNPCCSLHCDAVCLPSSLERCCHARKGRPSRDPLATAGCHSLTTGARGCPRPPSVQPCRETSRASKFGQSRAPGVLRREEEENKVRCAPRTGSKRLEGGNKTFPSPSGHVVFLAWFPGTCAIMPFMRHCARAVSCPRQRAILLDFFSPDS